MTHTPPEGDHIARRRTRAQLDLLRLERQVIHDLHTARRDLETSMIVARSRATVLGVRRMGRMLTFLREHGDTAA